MLKTVFSSFCASCALLFLNGCAQVLNNITPDTAQRNPSNLYRFMVQCNVHERSTATGSFKIDLVIDGRELALQPDPLAPSFYYCDYLLEPSRTEAKYYFQVNYRLNTRGRMRDFCFKTPLSDFQILEGGCVSLEAERAPIWSQLKVLGRGFNEQSRIRVGEYDALTTFESENVISFQVPAVVSDKSYPVYYLCQGEKIFISHLLIDMNRFHIEPNTVDCHQGEKIDFTVSVSSPMNEDLPVHITTNIPNSIIMPEVKIPAGETSCTVEIEGGEPGSGQLFVSAQGFEEVQIPATIIGNRESIRLEEELYPQNNDYTIESAQD